MYCELIEQLGPQLVAASKKILNASAQSAIMSWQKIINADLLSLHTTRREVIAVQQASEDVSSSDTFCTIHVIMSTINTIYI